MIAILDIHPYVVGHVLVMPKKHSRWTWDMPETEYSRLMTVVYNLANSLRKTFNTQWVEEVIAGFGVAHAHIHLLPRKFNDGIEEIPNKPLSNPPSIKEMKKTAEKIGRAFSASLH